MKKPFRIVRRAG